VPTPPAFEAAFRGGGSPSQYSHHVDVEKLEWCDYPMVKKYEDIEYIFIHFVSVYERDRRTDRQIHTSGGSGVFIFFGGGALGWRHFQLGGTQLILSC